MAHFLVIHFSFQHGGERVQIFLLYFFRSSFPHKIELIVVRVVESHNIDNFPQFEVTFVVDHKVDLPMISFLFFGPVGQPRCRPADDVISVDHNFHVLMAFERLFGDILGLVAPAVEHELFVCFEGPLHDEGVVVEGVPHVLDHQMGVDKNGLFGGFGVDLLEFEGGGQLRGEVVDEVGELLVVGGAFLEEGANLSVDNLHYYYVLVHPATYILTNFCQKAGISFS